MTPSAEGLSQETGRPPEASKNEQDGGSESEWDLPPLHIGDILMGEVVQCAKDADEVWIAMEGSKRFGIMVEPQDYFDKLERGHQIDELKLIGLRENNPLLQGPSSMHLSDEESPASDPTNNQPPEIQPTQEPARSRTSSPSAAASQTRFPPVSDPPNNQYKSTKADAR